MELEPARIKTMRKFFDKNLKELSWEEWEAMRPESELGPVWTARDEQVLRPHWDDDPLRSFLEGRTDWNYRVTLCKLVSAFYKTTPEAMISLEHNLARRDARAVLGHPQGRGQLVHACMNKGGYLHKMPGFKPVVPWAALQEKRLLAKRALHGEPIPYVPGDPAEELDSTKLSSRATTSTGAGAPLDGARRADSASAPGGRPAGEATPQALTGRFDLVTPDKEMHGKVVDENILDIATKYPARYSHPQPQHSTLTRRNSTT
ncbi:hypothetical protein CONLIGDRAFT_649740 [Coniochaeta ligniaria NRRL 30616]|uniref:Uncharacterized protein n=1 Tax=Coniochaeta ligniaria NRRL 30616 TaxID=1408157 RepID=A0A1J7J890_9PEZI|nr:hypothetical protein CONLIGDRAFT_649740 [Coniochaeta ligniaria NRRL 30616]